MTTKMVLPASRRPVSKLTISRAERRSTLENGSSRSKNFRIVEQRASQRHPLPHALRILAHGPGQGWIEFHGPDHIGTAVFLVLTPIAHFVQAREVAQVLHSTHFVVKQRRMGHVSELTAHGAKIGCSQHRNAPSRRRSQPGHSAQQGCLPCSVVAENGVETSGSKLRAHAAQGGEASILLDEIGNDDGGRHRIGR